MTIEQAAIELNEYLKNQYINSMSVSINNKNIYRGNRRPLSSDVEDGVAIFISRLLPDCELLVDPNINFKENPFDKKNEKS